jgi:4-hydroxybutyrate CoA-transferase
VLPLLKSGVVNGRARRSTGKTVSSFVVGNRELYDYLDGNERIALRPVDYTNSVDVISAHDRMVAIQLGVEVSI